MGQNAVPVIGYGLFDDASEWSPDRVKQYKQRGFVAIYMPCTLYNQLAAMNPTTVGLSTRQIRKYTAMNGYPATNITNIYNKPLLRKIEDFATDIQMYALLDLGALICLNSRPQVYHLCIKNALPISAMRFFIYLLTYTTNSALLKQYLLY